MPFTEVVPRLGGTKREWRGLAIAAVVFLLVIVVSYMCVQLFKLYPASPPAENFRGWVQYRPACSDEWLGGRRHCRGVTTGQMPSIDETPSITWQPCCGTCVGDRLGTDVPPPTHSGW